MTERAITRMRVSAIMSPAASLKATFKRWWGSQENKHKYAPGLLLRADQLRSATRSNATSSATARAPASASEPAQSQALVPFDRFNLAVAIVNPSSNQTALVHERQYDIDLPPLEPLEYWIERTLARHEVAIADLQASVVATQQQVSALRRKVDEISFAVDTITNLLQVRAVASAPSPSH